jgi:hypothetical protein
MQSDRQRQDLNDLVSNTEGLRQKVYQLKQFMQNDYYHYSNAKQELDNFTTDLQKIVKLYDSIINFQSGLKSGEPSEIESKSSELLKMYNQYKIIDERLSSNEMLEEALFNSPRRTEIPFKSPSKSPEPVKQPPNALDSNSQNITSVTLKDSLSTSDKEKSKRESKKKSKSDKSTFRKSNKSNPKKKLVLSVNSFFTKKEEESVNSKESSTNSPKVVTSSLLPDKTK